MGREVSCGLELCGMTLDELELSGRIWKDVQGMDRWRGSKFEGEGVRGAKACSRAQWVGSWSLWRLRTPAQGGPVPGKECELCCGTTSSFLGGCGLTNLAGWHLACVWGSPGCRTCLRHLKSFTDHSHAARWRSVCWPICREILAFRGCHSRLGEGISTRIMGLAGNVCLPSDEFIFSNPTSAATDVLWWTYVRSHGRLPENGTGAVPSHTVLLFPAASWHSGWRSGCSWCWCGTHGKGAPILCTGPTAASRPWMTS